MDRLHHQLLHASCKIIDALKDIDARLTWLDDNHDMTEHPFKPPRHDAVWESLDISAAQLKLLMEEPSPPAHGEEKERKKVTKLKGIEVECQKCHGKGKVGRPDCPVCKGRGKVEVL